MPGLARKCKARKRKMATSKMATSMACYLGDDFDTHRPRRALDRHGSTLGDTGRLLQQNSCWRCLSDKGKAAIGINRDDDRNNQACHLLVLRTRIELLAEFHDVDLRL